MKIPPPPLGNWQGSAGPLVPTAPCGIFAQGKKLYFHPMCLYSTYSDFSGESKNGQKWAFSKIAQNGYPIPENYVAELASVLVGGTLHFRLESPGFNS